MKSHSGDRDLLFRSGGDESHYEEEPSKEITKAKRLAPEKWLIGKNFAPTLLFNGSHPDIAFSKLYKLLQGSKEGYIKLNPEFYSLTVEVKATLDDIGEDKAVITVSAEIEVELHESVDHQNIYVAEFSLVKGDFTLFSDTFNTIQEAYDKK